MITNSNWAVVVAEIKQLTIITKPWLIIVSCKKKAPQLWTVGGKLMPVVFFSTSSAKHWTCQTFDQLSTDIVSLIFGVFLLAWLKLVMLQWVSTTKLLFFFVFQKNARVSCFSCCQVSFIYFSLPLSNCHKF